MARYFALSRHVFRHRRLSGSVLRRRLHNPPEAAAEKSHAAAEKKTLDFLAERGRALGINLTLSERKLIAREVGRENGRLCKSDWENILSRRSLVDQEKLTLSDFLAKSHDGYTGQDMLKWTSRLGIGFFALVGGHTAGEAGMHVVGSTLVGCITGLGGGTFNSVVTGSTPVGWVRDPTFLVITAGAALVGFYVWPLAELLLQDGENRESGGVSGSSKLIIEADNGEGDGIPTSALRYSLESIALGSLAVVGAQQGIVRGLHPVVSSSLGVTIALGGVVRDLMCRRDLSLGATTGCQSYGLASFSGAAVYVALRELHVWNCAGSAARLVNGGIPIGLRILLGFSTVFGIRAVAWRNKPDGLLLSMEESAEANQKWLQGLYSQQRSERNDEQ